MLGLPASSPKHNTPIFVSRRAGSGSRSALPPDHLRILEYYKKVARDDQRQIDGAMVEGCPGTKPRRSGRWESGTGADRSDRLQSKRLSKRQVTLRTAGISIVPPKAAPGLGGRIACLSGVVAFLLVMTALPFSAGARVLNDGDLERISAIKKLSVDVMTDVTMLSRRTDLSGADSACIGSTLRSLTQISGELQSYQYLITIESQLNDFGDDQAMRGILRFAVENSLQILDTEHRHLSELSDQCSRYPLSADKTKQAMQFIESTTAILKSIQPRL
jgi:hypothetical protein